MTRYGQVRSLIVWRTIFTMWVCGRGYSSLRGLHHSRLSNLQWILLIDTAHESRHRLCRSVRTTVSCLCATKQRRLKGSPESLMSLRRKAPSELGSFLCDWKVFRIYRTSNTEDQEGNSINTDAIVFFLLWNVLRISGADYMIFLIILVLKKIEEFDLSDVIGFSFLFEQLSYSWCTSSFPIK